MDKYMDARFDAVEKALGAFVNSISSWNPSVAITQDLLGAHEDLYAGLVQLEIHQNNYQTIQELREETAALDKRIKDILLQLWDTRKEIKATPVTKTPQARPGHDFSYKDLLSYASRISHTSRPPPGVTNGVDLAANRPAADGSSPAANEGPSAATANNTAAPNGAGANADASAAASSPSATQPPQGTALPVHMRAAVNAREGHIHYPWPTEQQIRSGALSTLQRLADRGIDPKNYDPEEEERRKKEAELEKQRVAAAEEEARREKERAVAEQRRQERERLAKEREAEQAARPSSTADAGPGPAGGSAEPAPVRQFQFAGGMDDDDDED